MARITEAGHGLIMEALRFDKAGHDFSVEALRFPKSIWGFLSKWLEAIGFGSDVHLRFKTL